MTNQGLTMNDRFYLSELVSWTFGIAVFAAGLLNIFLGNDAGFGAFLLLISFVYFPPANSFLKSKTGFAISMSIKILLAACLIVAVLGVGELFNKIELMRGSF